MLPAMVASAAGDGVGSEGLRSSRTAPLWQRLYVDLALLALAGLLFWQSANTGYQLVLAPEGVAATAVDYKAFISPALFWTGGMLLPSPCRTLFASGRKALCRIITPFTGTLAPTVAASMSRQGRRLALGTAMLALAVSFAVYRDIQHHIQCTVPRGRGTHQRIRRDRIWHYRVSGRRASC